MTLLSLCRLSSGNNSFKRELLGIIVVRLFTSRIPSLTPTSSVKALNSFELEFERLNVKVQ